MKKHSHHDVCYCGPAAIVDTSLSSHPRYNLDPPDERYRGVVAIADLSNTGIVNGERMHPGDFVLFTGVTVGIWWQNRLMQWDGVRWNLLPIEGNRDKYMLALNDLTEGAPDGIFSTAFIRTLFADMAMLNVLDVLCTLRLAAGGRIQSATYIPGEDGFSIDSIGNAEFNTGTFRNILITGRSMFQGDIISGPLELLSSTPQGTERVYPVGTIEETIWNRLGGNPLTSVTEGSFGNRPINAVILQHRSGTVGAWSHQYWEVLVRFPDNSTQIVAQRRARQRWGMAGNIFTIIESDVSNTIALASVLRFRYITSGKTFRLVSMPRSSSDENTVWRDQSGFLRIGPIP